MAWETFRLTFHIIATVVSALSAIGVLVFVWREREDNWIRLFQSIVVAGIVAIMLVAFWSCAGSQPPPPPVHGSARILELTGTPTTAPPCPGMTWRECLDWAFDRSLTYEERYEHERTERELQDERLAIATSTSAEDVGEDSEDQIGVSLLLGVALFLAGVVTGGGIAVFWHH